jgi:hypothetical protein
LREKAGTAGPGRGVALLLYVALIVGLSWSLLTRLDTALAGVSHDIYINPWADWWTKKALVEGLDFYHTQFLFYPQGVSLAFHSFSHTTTVLSLFLASFLGTFPGYNLALLATYPLAAYAMYLLAYDLTASRPAAFVAGIVYSFQPYHIYESAHPVLVATQWIPLFALAVVRLLRGAAKRPGAEILLGGIWFLLTSLSSWHLMVMLCAWTLLYVGYRMILGRREGKPNAGRHLLFLALAALVLVMPFLWPIAEEYVVSDDPYVAVQLTQGRGNDLLSFLVPNTWHPFLGPLAEGVNSRLSLVKYRPGYLGYAALALAVIGAVAAWPQVRFWVLSGLLWLVLSLGLYVEWAGVPLNNKMLPWAIPIVQLLRHPFRLNVLLFFSLAVAAAFGCRRLLAAVSHTRPAVRLAVPFLVASLILFEYLVWPFPHTEPTHSAFYDQLAREEGEFAIAEFPTGRRQEKFYLYYQTIHGKPITGGVVSRMPTQAYAFVEANPVLRALHWNVPSAQATDVEAAFSALAGEGIRYVIVHRGLMDAGQLQNWHSWVGYFPEPVYKDEGIFAYSTTLITPTDTSGAGSLRDVDVLLGTQMHLDSYTISSSRAQAGDVVYVTLFWTAESPIDQDYHVFVHLLDGSGELVSQHDGVPVYGSQPTYAWTPLEQVADQHSIFIDGALPPGSYSLSVGVYDYATMARLKAIGADGTEWPDGSISLQQVEVIGP